MLGGKKTREKQTNNKIIICSRPIKREEKQNSNYVFQKSCIPQLLYSLCLQKLSIHTGTHQI